jgi:D-serine deaminase-like pyridoxal phosphate-dependent protein
MLNTALETLSTPALILDEDRMLRNVQRLRDCLLPHGVSIRPHLKTVKSVEGARRILEGGNGPATVSTLKEAEVFAAAGVTDILYAVGIAPDKLERVCRIRAGGCSLSVTLDTAAQAEAVVKAAKKAGMVIPALIEIDCDNHRAGLNPHSPELLRIGRILAAGSCLRGVMTHAGESYKAVGADALAACAEVERAAVVQAAGTLAGVGLACPVVSVGATPTAHFARDLSGVTEVRAGVYVMFDLVMAGTGTCTLDDIALSVLTTVIGHQQEQGWIMVDAGWMALSRDRGTATQAVDQGYGLVCDVEGRLLEGLFVLSVNQEHGIVASRPGASTPLPHLPLGTRLRILPNHACATGGQHDGYHVVQAAEPNRLAYWPRFRGW